MLDRALLRLYAPRYSKIYAFKNNKMRAHSWRAKLSQLKIYCHQAINRATENDRVKF